MPSPVLVLSDHEEVVVSPVGVAVVVACTEAESHSEADLPYQPELALLVSPVAAPTKEVVAEVVDQQVGSVDCVLHEC